MLTTASRLGRSRLWMTVTAVQILRTLVLSALPLIDHRRLAIYLTRSVLATLATRATPIGGPELPRRLPDGPFDQTPSSFKAQLQSSIQLLYLINFTQYSPSLLNFQPTYSFIFHLSIAWFSILVPCIYTRYTIHFILNKYRYFSLVSSLSYLEYCTQLYQTQIGSNTFPHISLDIQPMELGPPV